MMSKLKPVTSGSSRKRASSSWLLACLMLAPLALSVNGCNNTGVIGDDCPDQADCMPGTTGGSSPNPSDAMCGGLLGKTCADGQFCDFASSARCGASDQTGTCRTMPKVCTEIYAPVCGCDGTTYSSDCAAHGAGVAVAATGECDGGSSSGGSSSGGSSSGGSSSGGSPNAGGTAAGGSSGGSPAGGGVICGGIAALSCKKGQFCNYPPRAQCGAADQTGVCTPQPQACNFIYAPVCGCDDTTYSNDCLAASAGVSVAYEGECKPAGNSCGGRSGGKCATDEYCKYAPSALCGRADAPGTCVKLPPNQGCDKSLFPVCGCDGKTYGNKCLAEVAGISIDHDGACGKTCGGLLPQTCDKGFFCDYPPNMACGAADGTGICTETPSVCTTDFNPVCGCNGKTYGNACAARAGGVSVAHAGACKP